MSPPNGNDRQDEFVVNFMGHSKAMTDMFTDLFWKKKDDEQLIRDLRKENAELQSKLKGEEKNNAEIKNKLPDLQMKIDQQSGTIEKLKKSYVDFQNLQEKHKKLISDYILLQSVHNAKETIFGDIKQLLETRPRLPAAQNMIVITDPSTSVHSKMADNVNKQQKFQIQEKIVDSNKIPLKADIQLKRKSDMPAQDVKRGRHNSTGRATVKI